MYWHDIEPWAVHPSRPPRCAQNGSGLNRSAVRSLIEVRGNLICASVLAQIELERSEHGLEVGCWLLVVDSVCAEVLYKGIRIR
jgi:hypothetical protein